VKNTVVNFTEQILIKYRSLPSTVTQEFYVTRLKDQFQRLRNSRTSAVGWTEFIEEFTAKITANICDAVQVAKSLNSKDAIVRRTRQNTDQMQMLKLMSLLLWTILSRQPASVMFRREPNLPISSPCTVLRLT